MKKFIAEFKEFISKGDVMSMAVGIIIGGAFTAIVTSLVSDIITPILGFLLAGIDFTGISITVGSEAIMIGNFIQSIITFLLTALVLFMIIKSFNSFNRKKEECEEAPKEEPAELDENIKLLTEIRDLLQK